VNPEPKKSRTRAAVRRHTRRQHWVDLSLAPHAAQQCPQPTQQSPVVDLTVKFRTHPPMEFVVPLTRENLETAAKVTFWALGAIGVIELISDVSRRR